MAEIKSPLGNRVVNAPTMRNIDIPDDSGSPQYEERQYNFESGSLDEFQSRMQSTTALQDDIAAEKSIRQAKDARRSGKERLSDGARRRLEMLLDMTRLTKEIEIGGQLYGLRALQSKELREAMMASAVFDGTVEFPFEMRRQLLARSLTKIAGQPFAELIGAEDINSKTAFIDELDHALLTRLYLEHTILSQESQDKYAIKTESDASEVVADLKK